MMEANERNDDIRNEQQFVVYIIPNVPQEVQEVPSVILQNENVHVIQVPGVNIEVNEESVPNLPERALDLSVREVEAAILENEAAQNEDNEQLEAAQVQEEPEIQIIENQVVMEANELQILETDRHVVVEHCSKRPRIEDLSQDDMVDEAQKCSICLDMWSNSGDHRLCSLRCGHLFGLSCLKKWLEPLRTADRRCPECNTKATKKDIRVLYAKKLIAIDTAKLEAVKAELKEAQKQNVTFRKSIIRCQHEKHMVEAQLQSLKNRIAELESCTTKQESKQNYLNKISSFDICPKGGCRIMAFNPWHRTLFATLKSPAQSSTGHGLKKISLDTFSVSNYSNVHNGVVRDVAFPVTDLNVCLSVGFDKSVVLTDVRSLIKVHEYKTGLQLWSCCWAPDNSNFFYAGAQNGSILEFDWRYLQSTINVLETPEDRSPVVSLAPVPTFSKNYGSSGFLACHLNNCYAYVSRLGVRTSNRINLEGPFISVRYDKKDNHALISSRANPRHPSVRHTICSIAKDDEEVRCEVIHTLNGGTSQKLLSKPCHMYVEGDTLVAASNESSSSVLIWSVSSGKQAFAIPVAYPVIDTCSFEINNTFLALLTPHKVLLYRHGDMDETPRILNANL